MSRVGFADPLESEMTLMPFTSGTMMMQSAKLTIKSLVCRGV